MPGIAKITQAGLFRRNLSSKDRANSHSSKFLLINDHPDLRKIYSLIFAEQGIIIDVISHHEALDRLHADEYAVILTELNFNGDIENGFHLIRSMTNLLCQQKRRKVIVVFSDYADLFPYERYQEYGIRKEEVITLPIYGEKLDEKIQRLKTLYFTEEKNEEEFEESSFSQVCG